MELRAIAAYQQASQHTATERQRTHQPPTPAPQQALPAPLVVDYFTRNGQAQRIATGVHLDRRV